MPNEPGLLNALPIRRASLSVEDYIQPNVNYGLRIWWAYYWPTSLISFVIIGVLSLLLRRAWETDTLSTQFVLWAGRILPYAVMFLVSVLGIYRILGKKFRHFSVALLPRDATLAVEPLPRTSERTLRVWWAFIWRTIAYSLIFRFAGSIALGLTIGFLTSIGGAIGKMVPFVSQVLIDDVVGEFVIYSALLDEEFGDFRMTWVARESALSVTPGIEPTAPNPVPE
jgi:hypothetical protein